MLKTIIKRTGGTEPYSPNKVNNWGKWSAEKVGDRVDWGSIVMSAVRNLGEAATSKELQMALINECLYKRDWAHNLMAGRLYAATLRKELYGELLPSIKYLFKRMEKDGLMKSLNYSDYEYAISESIIKHERDFDMAHLQIHHIRKKYAIQNRSTKKEYETPQYVFMRMAMHLAEDEKPTERMKHVERWYNYFSNGQVNAPSPNYINLGTNHRGYASCCLYTVGDNADSLAIGDHIAYKMTVMSAGIGGYISTRTLGDPIRGGAIEHQGKMPYYKSVGGAVTANIQAGRGGACTQYYSVFDPEVMTITMAQNPRTVEGKKNRDIHFAMMGNLLFAKKVKEKKQIFTFTEFSAPDLHKLLFSGDQTGFEELYNKYEADPNFKKNYVDAEEIAYTAITQGFEVATHYLSNIDEANRHTSHKETIYSSNLCGEILQPTTPYFAMEDLYSTEDHGRGEVSLCSLAGIVEPYINSDEEYEEACYYALKMIDKCIHISEYPLPHVGFTAKKRLNAGVGLLGVAYSLAKKGIKYSSKEGMEEHHRIAERHAFFMIRASLRLGRELGNAPWIHKTKWPDGWLPIDTYKKSVDDIVQVPLQYDWETLRAEIIANGGIRNSSLISHMPTESSSKATGMPNCIYPIRELSLKKSDLNNIIDWCAPDSDILADDYESAWTIPSSKMIQIYGIYQKFADQGISADLWKDRSKNPSISRKEIVTEYLLMHKYGVKGRYYQNSLTSNQGQKVADTPETKPTEEPTSSTEAPDTHVGQVIHDAVGKAASADSSKLFSFDMEATEDDARGCAGGACTL